ncbi:hypothetical protein CR513_59984, partial [Mucuna pruriens]
MGRRILTHTSCKLFPGTLRGVAMHWMATLPARSIRTFSDLAGSFISQFTANKVKKLEVADLFDIKQSRGESLKSFLALFNNAIVWVDDPDQKFFMKAFQKGLRVNPFSDALALRRPSSMEEIRARAEKHIKVEEDQMEQIEAERNPDGRAGQARDERANTRCPLGLYPVEGEEGANSVGNMPYQLVGIPVGSKRTSHGPRSGMYNDRQTADGKGDAQTTEKDMREAKRPVKREGLRKKVGLGRNPQRGTKGLLQPYLAGARHFCREVHEVQTVLTGANLTPLGTRRNFGPTITFDDRDLRNDIPSHDEPMVISMVAAENKIERVLVDQGSSTNILYWSTYQKMKLSPGRLIECSGTLYGFVGEQVPIKGIIELETVFGEESGIRCIPVLYTVVDVEVSYNIIMGRPALNRLGAIISTYHHGLIVPPGPVSQFESSMSNKLSLNGQWCDGNHTRSLLNQRGETFGIWPFLKVWLVSHPSVRDSIVVSSIS